MKFDIFLILSDIHSSRLLATDNESCVLGDPIKEKQLKFYLTQCPKDNNFKAGSILSSPYTQNELWRSVFKL